MSSNLAASPQAYRESAILTAPPERLVVMLYDGARRFLHQAAVAMRERRRADRARAPAPRRGDRRAPARDARHEPGRGRRAAEAIYVFCLAPARRGAHAARTRSRSSRSASCSASCATRGRRSPSRARPPRRPPGWPGVTEDAAPVRAAGRSWPSASSRSCAAFEPSELDELLDVLAERARARRDAARAPAGARTARARARRRAAAAHERGARRACAASSARCSASSSARAAPRTGYADGASRAAASPFAAERPPKDRRPVAACVTAPARLQSSQDRPPRPITGPAMSLFDSTQLALEAAMRGASLRQTLLTRQPRQRRHARLPAQGRRLPRGARARAEASGATTRARRRRASRRPTDAAAPCAPTAAAIDADQESADAGQERARVPGARAGRGRAHRILQSAMGVR